jgi:hypothetical protein
MDFLKREVGFTRENVILVGDLNLTLNYSEVWVKWCDQMR